MCVCVCVRGCVVVVGQQPVRAMHSGTAGGQGRGRVHLLETLEDSRSHGARVEILYVVARLDDTCEACEALREAIHGWW